MRKWEPASGEELKLIFCHEQIEGFFPRISPLWDQPQLSLCSASAVGWQDGMAAGQK